MRLVRQAFLEHRFSRVTDYRGITESWTFSWAPVNVRLESGDRFEFNIAPEYEFLLQPFEVAQGVTLPAGSYRFNRMRGEYQSSNHRRWEFGTTTWFGSFYDGRLRCCRYRGTEKDRARFSIREHTNW